MTVGEIVDFLNKYQEGIPVSMLSLEHDNPMEDDIPVKEIVAITSSDGSVKIVIRPV